MILLNLTSTMQWVAWGVLGILFLYGVIIIFGAVLDSNKAKDNAGTSTKAKKEKQKKVKELEEASKFKSIGTKNSLVQDKKNKIQVDNTGLAQSVFGSKNKNSADMEDAFLESNSVKQSSGFAPVAPQIPSAGFKTEQPVETPVAPQVAPAPNFSTPITPPQAVSQSAPPQAPPLGLPGLPPPPSLSGNKTGNNVFPLLDRNKKPEQNDETGFKPSQR